MDIFRPARPATFRRALFGVLAASALALAACGDGGIGGTRDGGGSSGRADAAGEGRGPNPTAGRGFGLESVDPSRFRLDGSDTYSFLFAVDGTTEVCFFDDASVTCTGSAGEDIPDLTLHFPGRPGAIEATGDGLRYTFLEGVRGHEDEVRLGPGEMVTVGDVTCGAHDHSILECTAGEGSFTIGGRDARIRTDGRVLPEGHGQAAPATSESTRATGPSATTAPRATGSDAGSGFVTEVRSGGRTVQASAPACDGRGVLILESVVEQSGVDTAGAIGAALGRYPDARFTTPGHCPSLRASLNGADVYAIFVDHGGDTSALCADKASRGGNARVLSDRNEYVDPC